MLGQWQFYPVLPGSGLLHFLLPIDSEGNASSRLGQSLLHTLKAVQLSWWEPGSTSGVAFLDPQTTNTEQDSSWIFVPCLSSVVLLGSSVPQAAASACFWGRGSYQISSNIIIPYKGSSRVFQRVLIGWNTNKCMQKGKGSCGQISLGNMRIKKSICCTCFLQGFSCPLIS